MTTSSVLATIRHWLADPTTIAGLASAAGAAVVSFYGGAPWPIDVAGFAASAILLVLPANTATAADIRRAFQDGVTVGLSHGQSGVAALAADVARLAADTKTAS